MSADAATLEEVETPTPAESAPSSLFEYARWAHAGSEAAFCEASEDGRCANDGHWHAWCRIPNDFQEREIREKALAAKARKVRQLRTNGTDSNEILENSVEALMAEPNSKELAALEIVGYDWAQDYLTAVRQVKDVEDPDAEAPEEGDESEKLFTHIEDDQARFARLSAEDPAERNPDEYTELEDHLKLYEAELTKTFDAIQGPKRESYEQMEDVALFELLRRKRVEARGNEEFTHARNVFTWLSCTYKEPNGEPCFENLAALERAPREVLAAVRDAHNNLMAIAQGALGN